jgi:pimeloyl-ACP methyl ester carboxylesterase
MIASIVGSTLKKCGSRRILLAFLLALASLAAVLWAPSPGVAVPVPKLDWRRCIPQGFQCATVSVPRNYSHPRRSTIHLAVIRHRATDLAHRIGTLFYNPGGPGESGMASLAENYRQAFSSTLRARFDLVSWDPRGVGASSAVRCFASRKDEERFLDGVAQPGASFRSARPKRRSGSAATGPSAAIASRRTAAS